MGYLTHEPIDLGEWHGLATDARDGASVEFVGIVRSDENGRPIAALDYEAYEPMAERVIERLVKQARAQWPLHAVCVHHRVGRVAVGEVAVLIGVRASHRDEAFEACRFLIDAIKRDVPMWKAAVNQGGHRLQPTCADGHETR